MSERLKIKIDIDTEEAIRKFTIREKAGIKILLLLFGIIFPMRYEHQLNTLLDGIKELF